MLPEKIPELIASRYRVVHPIGEGNMGTVYLVEHVYTGEELAMKVLQAHVGTNAKLVKRFKREAWLPARIRSDHVVRVIDADVAAELGNAPFLVMELLRGSDLEAYVQRMQKVPAAEVVGIYWQVADALSKAHALGIVHRDLKPENIFLHEHYDGRVIVKVLDFGISKMAGDDGNIEEARLTRTGAVLGTPLYMPPEQATGDTPRVGPPADMWALGLIAFRLLTGQVYWKAHTMAELLVEILTRPMEAPSVRDESLPTSFDAWFLRSCDRDPKKRFPTVWDQVKALAESLGIGPPEKTEAQRTMLTGQAPKVEGDPIRMTEHAETLRPQALPKTPSNPPPATMPSGALARSERERTHTRPSSRSRHNMKKVAEAEAQAKAEAEAKAQPTAAAKGSEPMQVGIGTVLRAGTDTLMPEGERRQLTIVSYELLPSTENASKLDPQKLRESMKEYEDAFAQVMKGYKGQPAQPLGEGQIAYFGYPIAREDDARRAVSAALELVETAQKLNSRHDKPLLDVRVGVHTGLVLTWEIVDDAATSKPAAIAGATPTMAWRLANLGRRNTVLISGTTYRLVRNYYQCASLGLRTLKGYAQPVETYQVSDESGAKSRIEGMTTGRLTPMVGRDLELGLMLDRWARVEEGSGQLLLISGEAGIGKSRLTRVFRDRLEASPHTWVETRCLQDQRDRSLFPIAGLVNQLFVLVPRDSPEEKISKIERALTHYGYPLPEVMPIFGALLGLPVWHRYPPTAMSTEDQRTKLQEVLFSAIDSLARRRPLVIMFADLHWADPATLAILGDIVHDLPTVSVMLLGTARPGFVPPWPARSHVSTVTLSRLTPKRVKMMVEEITKGKELPSEVFDQLVEKTDGVPLFVEEVTKMLLESGLLEERGGRFELTGPLPAFAIPATLRDSLMARLDRLGSAKRVAQLGAILGREFTYDLIEAVSPIDPATLQRELDRLVEADVLYQRGRIPRATYTFKYVLVQDTAYESLLHNTRQAYHRKIAQVLLQRSMAASQLGDAKGNRDPSASGNQPSQAGSGEKKVPSDDPRPPQKDVKEVLRGLMKDKPEESPLGNVKDLKKRPF
ncbi:protein kinase domain-containing protein [Polyangium sorediatum]|uniref:AAA family ATPase n=1 Tax=Polyangium sorediatum TaxID=889274 RepID=A0ABT6NTF6_9BACT|nr:AAA family ATPase [Polyangium sorediatum]MDI1431587.1 AAA family ATPase [Polyangium sorediatum]